MKFETLSQQRLISYTYNSIVALASQTATLQLLNGLHVIGVRSLVKGQ